MPAASSMTVAQLRKELGDRGLDTTGLKAALVARYEEALASGGPAADAEVDAGDAAPAAAAAAAEKEDDVVSLDAGDELGDAPASDGDEPSSKKTKTQTAGGSVQAEPAEGADRRELEKERKKSGACLSCGSMDHKGLDCPKRIAEMFCHICGNKGHKHADCPEKVDAPEKGCIICGAGDHGIFKCAKRKIDPNAKPQKDPSRGLTCSICRKQGHVKKDCPDRPEGDDRGKTELREQWCFVCGARATHKRTECPSAVKTADKSSCFVCGSGEHRAFTCPNKKLDPDAKCGTCGKSGHERRDCPDRPPEDVSKFFCFVCGETGHKRLECPARVPAADVPENGCIICGAAEHNMHKCPKKKVDPNAPPPKEKRKRDDGRGRDRSRDRGRDRSRDRGYGGRFDEHDHRRSRADSRDRYGGGGYGRRDDYRGGGYGRRDDSRDRYGGGPRYDSRNYAGGGGGFSGEQVCRDFQRGSCRRPDCRFKHVGGGGAPRSPDRRRSPPR
jgi:hypothetical protein